MANKKITELDAATSLASTDVVPVVDVSEDVTKKITTTNLFRTLPDGTAAAPALAFSSDAANGVYLAGTDTVGISTGGTQRVTVDGSGNVTISGDLQVDGATTTVQSTTVTIDDKNIELGSVASPSNTTADGGGLTLKGASDKTLKWINSTGCWTFNQPMNFNDHVRIDSSGRLLVGTSSEFGTASRNSFYSLFQIKGNTSGASSDGRIALGTGATTGSNTSLGTIIFNDTDGGDRAFIRGYSASAGGSGNYPGYLTFWTNAGAANPTERMRLDSSGQVIIGGTSPLDSTKQLTLTTTATSGGLGILSPDNGRGDIFFGDASDDNVGQIRYSHVDNSFTVRTNTLDRFKIDSSGRVGVGTSSPDAGIHLATAGQTTAALDTSGDINLLVSDTGALAGNGGSLVFGYNSGAGRFAAIKGLVTTGAGNSVGHLAFSTRNATSDSTLTERLRIDSSGNVGISNTTPSSYNAAADNLVVGATGDTGVTVASGSSNQGSLFFADGTSGSAVAEGYLIYVHGSNYMALGTVNTERLRIDSSGRLLVGTSNARNLGKLEVEGTTFENSSISTTRNVNGVGEVGINLNRTRGTTAGSVTSLIANDRIGSIVFRGADGTGLVSAAQIKAEVDGTPGTNDMPGRLVFSTTADGASSTTERMRIDSSGNVGIGTSSPSTKLEVKDTTVDGTPFKITGANNYGYSFRSLAAGGINGARLDLHIGSSAGAYSFTNSSSELLRIDNSGDIGVGSTTPNKNNWNKAITLQGGSNCAYELSDNGVLAAAFALQGDDRIELINFRSGPLTFKTNNTERMRVDSSGRLLVGTTTEGHSNGDDITVASSATTGITIRSGTSSSGNLYFSDGTSGDAEYRGYINYDHGNDRLNIGTSATSRLSINSNGAWGIEGATNYGTSGQVLTSNGNDSPTWQDAAGGGATDSISEGNTNVECVDTGSDGHILFDTEGTERMRIDSSGNLLLKTGEIDIQGGDKTVKTSAGFLQVGTSGSHHTAFITGGTEQARIDTSGRIGIGTTSINSTVDIKASSPEVRLTATGANRAAISHSASGLKLSQTGAANLLFETNGSERARIDSSGRVLIGTTTEGYSTADNLTIADSGDCGITIRSGASHEGSIYFSDATSGAGEYDGWIDYDQSSRYMRFGTAQTERVRIDSSGRLLLGHTSLTGDGDSAHSRVVVNGNTTATSKGGILSLENTATSIGSVNNGNQIGQLFFKTETGEEFGLIKVEAQGNASSTSCPARMVFSNTRSSATTPTEAMRIGSTGSLLVGTTNEFPSGVNVVGFALHVGSDGTTYQARFTCQNNNPLDLNRKGNDGDLVKFRHEANLEGKISVSGSTVTYSGGHLARWSQLAGGAERTEILRGSVMSNLDEMCEWAHAAQDAVLYTEEDELPEGVSVGDVKTPAVDAYTEDNEQLNRMKVSDVEGDVNVAGVFQGWDDDDDMFTNDFDCAMTGDFVIRIAQGTTVARGDLLMSAGDGTAKPQDDDIVRSKTIAKVTSTTVSTTYADGSYCVPCVLMAC